MNKWIWTILIIVFFGGWIFIFTIHYAFRDFVHEPGGRIPFKEIYFKTPEIKNYDQRLDVMHDVENFFANHPAYKLSSDTAIQVNVVWCGEGCISKIVHFKTDPIEIYRLIFFAHSTDTSSGKSYIEDVFPLKEGKFVSPEYSASDSIERKRFKQRLETEILEKIDWTLK